VAAERHEEVHIYSADDNAGPRIRVGDLPLQTGPQARPVMVQKGHLPCLASGPLRALLFSPAAKARGEFSGLPQEIAEGSDLLRNGGQLAGTSEGLNHSAQRQLLHPRTEHR
jgi:hypothetical protein